jgi:hypothetical protein
MMTEHPYAVGQARTLAHLYVSVVVAYHPAAAKVQTELSCCPLDHLRAGLAAATGAFEMGAAPDGVKADPMATQLRLHLRVDLIQRSLSHEPLAHSLLAGHQHKGVAPLLADLERCEDAWTESKLCPAQDIAFSRGDIDDSVSVPKHCWPTLHVALVAWAAGPVYDK